MIVLQILGGIFLAILMIVGVIYLYFRFKYGKYMSHDAQQEPLSIHLVEDVSPDWLEKSNAKTAVNELIDLGFCAGKAYLIYEMDGYFFQAFFKSPIVSVLYWHDTAGCWVDMVIDEIGGNEYTFSNAPMGSGMEYRPECEKVFDATASIRRLYEPANKLSVKNGAKYADINSGNFRDYFESTYKKDIAWKNRNGGISYEEFLSAENEAPFSSSKKNIEEAFITTKESELHQWSDAAIEDYLKSEGINEENIYDIEYKYFIVPYVTNASAFLRYLESRDFLNEAQSEKLRKLYSKESDMYLLFEKINNLFSPELRAKLIKEVDFPLSIKIYQLSKEMCS